MDIENTLKYIDEEYLSAFDRRCVYSEVGTQKAFAKRVITEKNYNIADGENIANKAIHALYAAMTDCMTTKESLAIRILNYVLIDMDGAPLKKPSLMRVLEVMCRELTRIVINSRSGRLL